MARASSVRLAWSGREETEQELHRLSSQSGRALTLTQPGSAALRLMLGDNGEVLSALLPEFRDTITLAYLDPPFFTMRQHEQVLRRPGAPGAAPVRILTPAFDDRWDSFESYLSTLRQRLVLLRELLAPYGSVVVHVDPRTSHYVKVLGDEVFGPENFASELIWRYRRWPARTANFQRVHDVLLRWVKDQKTTPRFVQQYEALAPSTLKTWGQGKQKAIVDSQGRRRRSSSSAKEQSPGVPLGDVWEIPIVAPIARERTGYPTQKPEALLERLVLSCTTPGDWVLDPFMGSGTSLAVAARLGRRAIGIDQSLAALTVSRSRLRAQGCEFSEYALVPSCQQCPESDFTPVLSRVS